MEETSDEAIQHIRRPMMEIGQRCGAREACLGVGVGLGLCMCGRVAVCVYIGVEERGGQRREKYFEG